LRFNTSTRTFSGTPGNGDVGAIDVKIITTDGSGASISDVFKLTVANVFQPGILSFSAPQFSVNEDGTPVSAVTLNRTDGSSGAVSVTLNLTNGKAKSPGDYNKTPITVNFADGETSKTITIPIINDTLIEKTETLNLSLVNPTDGATLGTQSTAILNILDDDVQIAFASTPFGVNEDGTALSAVTLTRTGRLTGSVGATLVLNDGTATAPEDYDNSSITVNFAEGESRKTIILPIVKDTTIEGNETINLSLINPTGGATIGTQSTASFIIVDNDTGSTGLVIIGDGLNNTLIGAEGNDTIYGGNGNDILDGAGGINQLFGGLGNDTYRVDSLDDQITENLSSGTDTVQSSINWTLGDNLENLVLTGSNPIDGIGNSLNNSLTGNSANNSLFGAEGNDRLLGGAGDDSLYGGLGNDKLLGQDGNDVLTGNQCKDVLTGGNNNDSFVYNALSDAGDTITDFVVNGEALVLNTLFDSLGYNGNTPILDGYMRLVQLDTNTQVQIDADGNLNGANFITLVTLNNVLANSLTASNFVV
jgi:Ca2+-binding RTX toxin-like protein